MSEDHATNSDAKVRQIAELTGVAFDDVHKIIDAQTDFFVAIGLVDEADEGQRAALLAKYPDLLRERVIADMGTLQNPVDYELEATIVQLQSGMSTKAVTDVLAAFHEVNELIGIEQTAEYRAWAREWRAR